MEAIVCKCGSLTKRTLGHNPVQAIYQSDACLTRVHTFSKDNFGKDDFGGQTGPAHEEK